MSTVQAWGVASLLEDKSGVCVRCSCVHNTDKEQSIESLLLVPKVNWFSESERSTIRVPFDCVFSLQR